MTARHLIGVLVRRWFIVLIGLGCTALVMYWAHGREGVYATQADVVFLSPISSDAGNLVEGDTQALINFAGMVEAEVNGSAPTPRLSSATATLYGSGVRNGYSITLPNTGGQWSNYFPRPVLSVEVVGGTENEVRTVFDREVTRIESIAARRQREAGADVQMRIRTELTPGAPAISYVPANSKRAAGAIGLLGAALTVVVAMKVDQRLANRRRRRERASEAADVLVGRSEG